MMPSEEILGKTVLIPKNGKPLYLGVGRVILPEHKDVPVEELGLLGYQFDAGRPDFEPVEPDIIHKHHKKSKHEINDSITVNIAETEEKK